MQIENLSLAEKIIEKAKSWIMKNIDGFLHLLSIWTETRNDGDTLKIRKKGVI